MAITAIALPIEKIAEFCDCWQVMTAEQVLQPGGQSL